MVAKTSRRRLVQPEVLLEALPTIQRVARHLSTARQGGPRVDADDLAQIGCLACLEALHRGLHVTGNPMAYLVVVARHAMYRHLGTRTSLITTPRKHHGYYPSLSVLSLDLTLSSESELTLLDTVPAAPVYI